MRRPRDDTDGTLAALVGELRAVGVPVSVGEHLDAANAIAHIPLRSREVLRAALQCALVKQARHLGTFNLIFDLCTAGSPAQDAGGVVAAPVLSPGGDAGVYLLDASDGTILRFISTAPSGVFAQPVFDGQSLLIADESATLPLTEYKAP